MATCPTCNGTGKLNSAGGVPGADERMFDCQGCRGTGRVGGGGSAPASGGNLSCLLGLAFLGSIVVAPVAAILIASTWWPAGPVRTGLELVFPDTIVVHAGNPDAADGGRPTTVLAVLGGLGVAALIAVGILMRRSANRVTAGDRSQLSTRLWGLVWALVLLTTLSLILPVLGISTGRDLVPGVVEDQPRYTLWWQIGVVVLVGVVVAALRSGIALGRAAKRAQRRAIGYG